MKTINLKLAGIIAFSLLTTSTFAQNWQTGGNIPCPGTDCVDAINNILGPQDNVPLRFNTNGLHRMRLMHIANGVQLQPTPTSLLNPLAGNRLSRVSISRDGNSPVTQPLSLLHLGYNFGGSIEAGFRSWQDLGAMFCQHTDNFYVGLRQKLSTDPTGRTSTVLATPNDFNDAVISWGDNTATESY